MDPAAANFNSKAAFDDGSCRHVGCLDPTAINYNPTAVVAGVCQTAVPGCRNPAAANFYPGANVDVPASCIFPGCMDSRAPNFDPTSTISDHSCQPVHLGCTNRRALNYNPAYNYDDGTCIVVGCMDSASDLYAPQATWGLTCLCSLVSNGGCAPDARRLQQGGAAQTGCCPIDGASNYVPSCSAPCVASGFDCCSFDVYGCMDSRALNYVSAATVQRSADACVQPIRGCAVAEGTLNYDSLAVVNAGCVYAFAGCTDSHASNYVPTANVDDGSCQFDKYGCADGLALNFDSTATVNTGCVFAAPPSPPRQDAAAASPSQPPQRPKPPPVPQAKFGPLPPVGSSELAADAVSGSNGATTAVVVVLLILLALVALAASLFRRRRAQQLKLLTKEYLPSEGIGPRQAITAATLNSKHQLAVVDPNNMATI